MKFLNQRVCVHVCMWVCVCLGGWEGAVWEWSHGNKGCSVWLCPESVSTGFRGGCELTFIISTPPPHSQPQPPLLSLTYLTHFAFSEQDISTAAHANWWRALDAAPLHGESWVTQGISCRLHNVSNPLDRRFTPTYFNFHVILMRAWISCVSWHSWGISVPKFNVLCPSSQVERLT